MHYLLELSSSANPDLNFWVSKLSKNSVLGVEMTCWAHRWLRPCQQGVWASFGHPIQQKSHIRTPKFLCDKFLIMPIPSKSVTGRPKFL